LTNHSGKDKKIKNALPVKMIGIADINFMFRLLDVISFISFKAFLGVYFMKLKYVSLWKI
jgi:hypothetical protein